MPGTSFLIVSFVYHLLGCACVTHAPVSEDAEEDGDAQEIPLPNVKASVLSKVRGD